MDDQREGQQKAEGPDQGESVSRQDQREYKTYRAECGQHPEGFLVEANAERGSRPEHAQVRKELLDQEEGGKNRSEGEPAREEALRGGIRDEDVLTTWRGLWIEAMVLKFPTTWRGHTRRTGTGLRQLLREDHRADLEEARHTCEFGILASNVRTS